MAFSWLAMTARPERVKTSRSARERSLQSFAAEAPGGVQSPDQTPKLNTMKLGKLYRPRRKHSRAFCASRSIKAAKYAFGRHNTAMDAAWLSMDAQNAAWGLPTRLPKSMHQEAA